MGKLDYHERLKKLNLYSLERRRERYMIIYGWQQLEEKRENVLKLTATEMKTVPGYSERVAAESNSIQHQAAIMRARR